MVRIKRGNHIWQILLWVTAMLILISYAVIWYWVVAFDTKEEIIDHAQTESSVYCTGYEIGASTDSWETTIPMSADWSNVEIYTGATVSCQIVNNNSYNMKAWLLNIEILQECYLNGFWCGDFEVHQFRDGNELINRVTNQKTDVKQLNIDINPYTDNMMIHLVPGDYLVYIPSVNENEDIVKAGQTVGIGFIFYYQENLDLSHWTLSFSNDLKMNDLISLKIVIVATLLWIIAFVLYLLLITMEKRMKDQMKNRIRNISVMADLYLEAYLLNIESNSAQLIKGDAKKLIWNLTGENVQETINNRIGTRCKEFYRQNLTEFMNLSTILDRMENTASVAFEYVDEEIGWCIIRIFKTGEENDRKRLVFTLQDINDEKKRIRDIEDRINLAEYKQNVSGSFLGTVADAFQGIASEIRENSQKILEQSNQEEIRVLADRINMNNKHLSLIQQMLLDLYEIECQKLYLNSKEYRIHEMLEEVQHILAPYAEGKQFEFSFNIDEQIPEILLGDGDRIEQILVILIFSSMLMTEQGFVKLSLFGKQYEDEEEMIFSIRDSAKGFSEEEMAEIKKVIDGNSIESFDNAALVYLKIINGILSYMGSELKIVSVKNEGTDFYFTVRQKIVK